MWQDCGYKYKVQSTKYFDSTEWGFIKVLNVKSHFIVGETPKFRLFFSKFGEVLCAQKKIARESMFKIESVTSSALMIKKFSNNSFLKQNTDDKDRTGPHG